MTLPLFSGKEPRRGLSDLANVFLTSARTRSSIFCRADVGAPVGEQLVQVGRQAEAVAPPLGVQVVARLIQRLQHRVDVADVPIGSPTARRTSGSVASRFDCPPLDSKKIVVITLRCSRAFLMSGAASWSSRVAWESSCRRCRS